jgi:uncharacterized protein
MSGAISTSRLRAGATLLIALAAILVVGAAFAEPRFPPLSGRVVDEAGLLSSADKAQIEQELAALEQTSTDQLVVYTARSLQGYEIEDFGYKLGRAWAVGQKDKNNGVILIVAPKERKVRIEVGRGLEPQLTDALSRLIIENAILPAFRRGDFAAGIKAGVHDIRDVLLGDAEAVKERARRSVPRSSGGNGFALVFLIAIVLLALLTVWLQAQETAHPNRVARDRRGRSRDWRSGDWGSAAGGWGGWGGPSGGGGGGGSGGFSGGGGDFGGGGASGGW